MESSWALSSTARLLAAGIIAMDLSRRLLKAKYVKMPQQNRYSLQNQKKHQSTQRKAKVMNSHLAILGMIRLPIRHTIVVQETILRRVDHRQPTQKLNFHHEFEMIGVIPLMHGQISDISQNTKVKESSILNRTRERICAEILGTKKIAEQS
jgi:hypothetical protein